MKKNEGLRNLLRGKSDNKRLFKSVMFALCIGFAVIVFSALIDQNKMENTSDGSNFCLGEYAGTIPLSENRTMSISVVFKADHSFKLTEQPIDPRAMGKPKSNMYTGTWAFDQAIEEIELKYKKNPEQITTFSTIEKGTIQIHYLRSKGSRTSGNAYNLSHKAWYQRIFN